MAIVRAVDNISLYRGDTPTFQYQIEDYNEITGVYTPINITNFEITAQVRYTVQSDQVWFTLPIVKTDAANGIFRWKITKAQSNALLPIDSIQNSGIYDMQIVINKGQADEEVITFLTGTFSVTKDITRDPSTPRSLRRNRR